LLARSATCVLLLQEALLNLYAFRHDRCARADRREVEALLTEGRERLAFDERELCGRAIEAERRLDRDRRVRDDPDRARMVLRRRVQHQRVEDVDVARFASEFDEVVATLCSRTPTYVIRCLSEAGPKRPKPSARPEAQNVRVLTGLRVLGGPKTSARPEQASNRAIFAFGTRF
jgi:hypothetical protein